MKVRDIMTRPVVSVGPDAPVSEAAALLVERGFSSQPVEDEAKGLVGVVGEADLVRGRTPAENGSPSPRHGERVGDVMTPSPITRESGSDVADVVGTMIDHRLRAIPIVEDGELVGILARHDVLRCVAHGEFTSVEVWRHRVGLVDHDRG